MPTSNTLCYFSLISVLVALAFTFLVWFRKHNGHIFSCYILKKYGNQVGRLVRDLTMYILVLLLSLCPPHSVFLCFALSSYSFFFLSVSPLIFFSMFASKTGSVRVPKSWVFRFKRVKIQCVLFVLVAKEHARDFIACSICERRMDF